MMIRQFLKGQLFTRKYLDFTSDCFWLPDTFGYNAAIPQIMLGCEVKYFYTTKISWNDLNEFPLDTFYWKGIDGSEVLTHFNLTHTFPDVENVVRAVNSIKVKQVTDSHLLALGFGDGGGGPTYGMLEDSRRSHDLKGLPVTEFTTISQFMKDLEKDSEKLPLYNGELYLELHRGTLTQMHDIKRNNRKAEFALHNMEFLNVLANKEKNERSDELCEILLKNQFHDILPGTSITRVNVEARKEMTELITDLKKITCNYMKDLTDGQKDKVTVFNTLAFERKDDIYLENIDGLIKDAVNQNITDIKGRKYLVVGDISIPGASAKTLSVVNESPCVGSSFKYDGKILETPYAVIVFDDNGYISSFIDKPSGRELRRQGGDPLNVFLMGEDVPQYWDDWDIEVDLKLKLKVQNCFKGREVVSDGKLQMRLRSTYSIGEYSTLTQDIIVYKNNPRVDFHTVVDWNDKHSFLKVGFDVDVSAAYAKNEIQFGHIDRPVTRNNCLEAAKFEV
jgi:alpha-mannosidase